MLFGQDRCHKVAIIGPGGVGKTQVALELAYQIKENYPDCSIFWVSATTIESFEEGYLNIGRQLQLPSITDKTADVRGLVQQHLSQESSGQWLMVLNNADDVDVWLGNGSTRSTRLIDFLPRSSQGVVLFTTCNREAAVKMAQSNIVAVAEMDEDTATELLRRSLILPEVLRDKDTALELQQQLAYHPLAIVQAAAYINENGISIREYLSLLRDAEANVIEVPSKSSEGERRYRLEDPVAATWLVSFNQVRQRQAFAADYLSFMSCLDSRNIPLSLLPAAPSNKTFVDAIRILSAYSLITRQQGGQSIDLHQLVHSAMRNWLRKEGSLAYWTKQAVRRLAEDFPGNKRTNRPAWAIYLPHAQYVLKSNVHHGAMDVAANLQHKVGLCLLADGKYNEAEELLVGVMDIRERVLGERLPNSFVSMAELASIHRREGRWKEAEELEAQLTEILVKVRNFNPFL